MERVFLKREHVGEKQNDAESQLVNVPVNEVHVAANHEQLDVAELEDLARSIDAVGLIHPPVRRLEDGKGYLVVSGERRVRACKQLGLKNILFFWTNLMQTLLLAVVENLQRVDLNPVEEASSYKELVERRGLSVEECAAQWGKTGLRWRTALEYFAYPRWCKGS